MKPEGKYINFISGWQVCTVIRVIFVRISQMQAYHPTICLRSLSLSSHKRSRFFFKHISPKSMLSASRTRSASDDSIPSVSFSTFPPYLKKKAFLLISTSSWKRPVSVARRNHVPILSKHLKLTLSFKVNSTMNIHPQHRTVNNVSWLVPWFRIATVPHTKRYECKYGKTCEVKGHEKLLLKLRLTRSTK